MKRRHPLADENGDIASVKPGRAPSLGRGLSGIIGGTLFGVLWLSFGGENPPTAHVLIGYFVIVSAIIGGLYDIYNAFARNRFSDQDIVAPYKETDLMDKALGYKKNNTNGWKTLADERTDPNQGEDPEIYNWPENDTEARKRKYSGTHCPYCGSEVNDKFLYCTNCGKQI